mmetsp:Transcript_12550/g.16093  ORF Transcript_12550/g.16093 Transcript_12550/m.16093 type:complete len:115 (+) Transcript_12550:602-946(+)
MQMAPGVNGADPRGLAQFQASDFELQAKPVAPQVTIAPVMPTIAEQPRTMGTLQQLTAKSLGEEVSQPRNTIAPIFKAVPKQDPAVFKAPEAPVTTAAGLVPMTMDGAEYAPIV